MENVNRKTMVLCGDSFHYGIGCSNLATQPYGVLVAQHFEWDLVRLARGSASHYAIYLQAKYAASMNPKPHLVIIGTTSNDRIEWVAEGSKLEAEPTLENLNYHLYPPHYHPQPEHDKPMDFYLKGDPKYDPKILSEQVVAFSDYLKMSKTGAHLKNDYYRRLFTEPIEKIELIEKYYFDIFDEKIKRDYDIGLLLQAYTYVRRQGINCIVLGQDPKLFELIDEKDVMNHSWHWLSELYPDRFKSMHVSEEGHAVLAPLVIEYILKAGYGE